MASLTIIIVTVIHLRIIPTAGIMTDGTLAGEMAGRGVIIMAIDTIREIAVIKIYILPPLDIVAF